MQTVLVLALLSQFLLTSTDGDCAHIAAEACAVSGGFLDGDGGVPEACGADDGVDAPAECDDVATNSSSSAHAHCSAGGDVGL